MSTYAQLREQILILLDKTGDTGDIKTAVDYTMKQVLDELVVDARPDSLFTKSASVDVTSATTSIPLNVSGFGVTSLDKIFTLTVDYQDQTPAVERDWTFISWPSWIRESDDYLGNARANRSWTMDPSNNIWLKELPATGQTWKAYLYYYTQTAAVTDGGIPEIPAIHHQAIVQGTVTRFPQFFQGDRQQLLSACFGLYRESKARYLRDRGNAKKDSRFRPALSNSVMGSIWPNDILPIP